MLKRGAKNPNQLEEQLAFKNESEAYRNELRRATVEDVSYFLWLSRWLKYDNTLKFNGKSKYTYQTLIMLKRFT